MFVELVTKCLMTAKSKKMHLVWPKYRTQKI